MFLPSPDISSNPRAEAPKKDSQLAKLIKKNVAKVEKKQTKKAKVFDPTLKATQRPDAEASDADDIERAAFFKEMKRREF